MSVAAGMDGPAPGRSFRLHASRLIQAASLFFLLHLIFIVKITPLELSAFLTIVCLGWAIARRDLQPSWHILYFPLIVYGVVSSLSAAAADRRIHQGFEAMLWFKMAIFPAAVMLYREVPRLRDLGVRTFALVAGGASAWGLFQFAFLDNRSLENRISGPSSHVMTYSGILMPLSLMMLILWWRERRWWQALAGGLATLTLLLTFTRSVWLGWLVAAFVILALTRVRLAFYALPVLLLFVTFLPLPLFGRLVSTFDVRQSSNFDRIRMVEAGIEMIRDFPILGVGPANVKETYALYRKQDAPRARPPHLHNNVVQLWAERGLMGLGAYLLLNILFLRECARSWRGPGRIWAEIGVAICLSLGVAGLFEFNFGDTEVFYLLLNLMALVVISLERARPESNELQPGLVAASTRF